MKVHIINLDGNSIFATLGNLFNYGNKENLASIFGLKYEKNCYNNILFTSQGPYGQGA